MNAKEEKERAFNIWYRGSRRAEKLRNLITVSLVELENLEAIEQLTREDCYGPIVHLAQVWTSCKARTNNRR